MISPTAKTRLTFSSLENELQRLSIYKRETGRFPWITLQFQCTPPTLPEDFSSAVDLDRA